MSGASETVKPQPRSLLFVPAHEERKLTKAMTSGADALLLDLEDSVAPDSKANARKSAAQFLGDHVKDGGRPLLFVRVNDLTTGLTRDDLEVVLPQGPDGIMLPKANSGAEVAACATMIADIDAAAAGRAAIIAIATETPLALLQMQSFAGCHPRLDGLAWGAEDLSAAVGASAIRTASGEFTAPVMLARNLCLFGAHAAGVQAIDAIYADFHDEAGLKREADDAARDGFTGKMAIHPAQIAVINAAFTPAPDAIAEARDIVDAFAANPSAGAIGLHGRMIDRPHLTRALRLLARAQAADQ